MTSITGSSYLDTLMGGASSSSSATTTTAKAAKASNTIDQSGFLKLLTAQLKTQDPTEPVDNSQMVAQMAQFSSVAGISEMNVSLKTMAGDLSAARFGDASGWIGRAALVTSDIAAPASNGAYAGQITLPASANDVTLSLVDTDGQTVHSADLGAHDAGAVGWSWDGKDAAGKAVSGPLRMIVGATPTEPNTKLTPAIAAWTEVSSVQSPASGTTKLITALGAFAPADVQALS